MLTAVVGGVVGAGGDEGDIAGGWGELGGDIGLIGVGNVLVSGVGISTISVVHAVKIRQVSR
jgi:hypothetical protein